jgi:hypothetical protein
VCHLLFGHRLGLEVNLEEVDVKLGKFISNASGKILPRGFHHMLPSHPLQGAETILILKEHNSGIELAYYLLRVVVRESHQRNKTLFFAYLECIPNVLGLGLELVHVDGVLRATPELL